MWLVKFLSSILRLYLVGSTYDKTLEGVNHRGSQSKEREIMYRVQKQVIETWSFLYASASPRPQKSCTRSLQRPITCNLLRKIDPDIVLRHEISDRSLFRLVGEKHELWSFCLQCWSVVEGIHNETEREKSELIFSGFGLLIMSLRKLGEISDTWATLVQRHSPENRPKVEVWNFFCNGKQSLENVGNPIRFLEEHLQIQHKNNGFLRNASMEGVFQKWRVSRAGHIVLKHKPRTIRRGRLLFKHEKQSFLGTGSKETSSGQAWDFHSWTYPLSRRSP